MGLKSNEREHLLIRQLKLTANEPVIAKPLDYGIASFDEYKLIAISIGILAH